MTWLYSFSTIDHLWSIVPLHSYLDATEAINPGRLKPGNVIASVNATSPIKINHADHKNILAIFSIRPYREFKPDHDPFDTNTKYCHYDEAHKDYLYQESWVKFLISNITNGRLTKDFWRENYDKRVEIEIKDYEIE